MTRYRTHPAHWPLAAQLALFSVTALACAISGLLMGAQELSDRRQLNENHLRAQQSRLTTALRNAARLPALQAQQAHLAMTLQHAESSLWLPTQAALLQNRLAQAASDCELTLESFRPRLKSGDDALAATGEVQVGGSYAGLTCFATQSSQAPSPVQFESMTINARTDTSQPLRLLMKATVRPVFRSQPLPATEKKP